MMYAMLREVSELAGIARRGMWFLEPGLTSTHDQPKPQKCRDLTALFATWVRTCHERALSTAVWVERW